MVLEQHEHHTGKQLGNEIKQCKLHQRDAEENRLHIQCFRRQIHRHDQRGKRHQHERIADPKGGGLWLDQDPDKQIVERKNDSDDGQRQAACFLVIHDRHILSFD